MQKRRKFTVKESFDVKFTAWPPSDSTNNAYSPLLTNAKLNLIVVEIYIKNKTIKLNILCQA